MADAKPSSRHPWLWIPPVYFAEGMPNALVATVSVMLYNDLGVSNQDTAFFTSLLYLPWVIKPLWSPAVDMLKTRGCGFGRCNCCSASAWPAWR